MNLSLLSSTGDFSMKDTDVEQRCRISE